MDTETVKGFRTYCYGEGKTGGGQFVEYTCRSEDREAVQRFLAENVRSINVPSTKRVSVAHGGYGQYTRYDIVQHEYAGGGYPGNGGFIEVLEIRNPPDGRHGIVVHRDVSGHSTFYEFLTLPDAVNAWKHTWGVRDADERLQERAGFLRRADCGLLLPWFYAVGDQLVLGDVAFPASVEPSTEWIPMKQYLVYDKDGMPTVKTCLTASTVGQDYRQRTYVHWTDGTCWDPFRDRSDSKIPAPRMLTEGERWVEDLVQQFRQFLAGGRTSFEVHFQDGSRFTCRYKSRLADMVSKAGIYHAVVRLTNGLVRKGEFEFRPSDVAPTVEQFIGSMFRDRGLEVAEIRELTLRRTLGSKRKWIGVYNPAAAGRLVPAETKSE